MRSRCQQSSCVRPCVRTTASNVLNLILTGFIVIAFFFFILIEETKLSEDDEMEKLYKSLEQASLSPLGDRRPSTKKELRKSFVKRCKNPSINEKLHKIRTLNSTLKVKNFRLWMNSVDVGHGMAGSAERFMLTSVFVWVERRAVRTSIIVCRVK